VINPVVALRHAMLDLLSPAEKAQVQT